MSFMHQPHSAQGCLTTIQWMIKRQNCCHYFFKSSLPRSTNRFCGEVSASTPDNCECGQPGKEHSIYKILCTKYQKSWLVEGGNIPCFITMAMVTPSHNTWRAWWRNLIPFFWVSLENARKILSWVAHGECRIWLHGQETQETLCLLHLFHQKSMIQETRYT